MTDALVEKNLDLGVPGVPMESGDHICALYVSQAERDQIMLPFLRAGLRAGDRCFCVRGFVANLPGAGRSRGRGRDASPRSDEEQPQEVTSVA